MEVVAWRDSWLRCDEGSLEILSKCFSKVIMPMIELTLEMAGVKNSMSASMQRMEAYTLIVSNEVVASLDLVCA